MYFMELKVRADFSHGKKYFYRIVNTKVKLYFLVQVCQSSVYIFMTCISEIIPKSTK